MTFIFSKGKMEEDIARRVADTCEHILSEMGAELHDDLVQRLSVFRLYIDQLERCSSETSDVELIAVKMRSEFDQVIRAVRSISRRLLPTRMDGETLDRTVAILCQNMEHPSMGHVHFENQGTPVHLLSKVEHYLFRVVQELIHNAFKHSAAWHVWVRLNWDSSRITIEVEDDGTGFSKVSEFIRRLKQKNNTLRLRCSVIGHRLVIHQVQEGYLQQSCFP